MLLEFMTLINPAGLKMEFEIPPAPDSN